MPFITRRLRRAFQWHEFAMQRELMETSRGTPVCALTNRNVLPIRVFVPPRLPRRFRCVRINRFHVLARGKVLRDRDVAPNVELTFVTRLVRRECRRCLSIRGISEAFPRDTQHFLTISRLFEQKNSYCIASLSEVSLNVSIVSIVDRINCNNGECGKIIIS